jgi:hypothetical protein
VDLRHDGLKKNRSEPEPPEERVTRAIIADNKNRSASAR